ncbi:MAG: MoaD/ThiS family protein [Candidatus Methanofastidiosia archaeon]
MKIKIKLLGNLKKLCESSEISMELERATLGDVLKIISKEYPRLSEEIFSQGMIDEHYTILLNNSPSELGSELEDGDEIIIFLPLAGG